MCGSVVHCAAHTEAKVIGAFPQCHCLPITLDTPQGCREGESGEGTFGVHRNVAQPRTPQLFQPFLHLHTSWVDQDWGHCALPAIALRAWTEK